MNGAMALLARVLEEEGIGFGPQTMERFEKYMRAVLDWNERINLTAIRNEEEFIVKHFVDSVMCAANLKASGAEKIVDVGTGAGFPGIPLAIVFPERRFLLVDSTAKKLKVIETIASELGISNVTCMHARAEDLGSDRNYRESFDYCTSRAVAALPVLSEYCLPFVREGGIFAAYKSSAIEEELQAAKRAIRVLGGEIQSVRPFSIQDMEIGHCIIYIKKVSKTPEKYPRKAGKPLKEPI